MSLLSSVTLTSSLVPFDPYSYKGSRVISLSVKSCSYKLYGGDGGNVTLVRRQYCQNDGDEDETVTVSNRCCSHLLQLDRVTEPKRRKSTFQDPPQ